ncbi:putative secreted protein [Wickerhamomyces ciferrii]|uniref:Secreted protein n=1 Tax=Wickerhamomyces ciferrii (strain ATCC 14091 / BCRC 22168 / CBS 111 / JCM 3599 / NBRC 0793 / NRRL Y-1031 F-60-10) TaxID=1206466 RepID=K0KQ40_WICCF|nr:uncharacterized protein BN7_2851 [Wickerhamomyces ciferrii]CCH43303.1 putative secreted protein [Wickerhamomyces ciferrii]
MVKMRLKFHLFWWIWLCQVVISQSFEDIFNDLLPERLKDQYEVGIQSRLFANRYHTVEELVINLVGDPHYINTFDFNKPHNMALDDYTPSETKSMIELTNELEFGMYAELLDVYQRFYKVYDILGDMTVEDFIAVYDNVYGDQLPEEVIEGLSAGLEDDWLFKNMFEFNNGFDLNNFTSQPFIPFVDLDDYVEPDQDSDSIDAQIFLSLFKIPVFIAKLIAKIIWYLIKLKKYLELLETKIVLYIIKLIKLAMKIIRKIKRRIIWLLKNILNLYIPYRIAKKILAIIHLIIKYLRILCWEFQDILYRYQWKLIFAIKHAEKKFLLWALFFKECIYGKLDKPSKEELLYKDFVDADDDYYDWDDYDYFKEFSHYIYNPTYKTKDEELQKVIDYLKDSDENDYFDQDDDDDDDDREDDDDYTFDLKEEFGFDTVRLNLGKNVYFKSKSKNKNSY